MSDYRNDDENKELTGQTMSDNHKTEDKHEDEYEKYCYLCRRPESVDVQKNWKRKQQSDAQTIEKSKKMLGQMESVLGADSTIESLCDDIVEHYEKYSTA